MALVESRSWTNRGSVGTSKENRSALPAQLRNGLDMALSRSIKPTHCDVEAAKLSRRAGLEPRDLQRGTDLGELLTEPGQHRLALLTRRVLPVPVKRGGERGIIAVGYRRLFLLKGRLRPHVGPHWARRLGMFERFVLGSRRLLLGHRSYHLRVCWTGVSVGAPESITRPDPLRTAPHPRSRQPLRPGPVRARGRLACPSRPRLCRAGLFLEP